MSFLGGLVDSFNGAGARRDIDRGIRSVGESTERSAGAIRGGASEAQGYIRPYREQGGRAYSLYGDTLGVNGTEARGRAQDTYLSDPMLQSQLALQQKQRGWASNSRGGYGSGADALAASRVNLEGYGNWQNRLGQAGQEGQAAAGTSAGIASRAGEAEAGAYSSGAGAIANLYGQRAQSENALAQNLIGVGGVAASYFGGGGNRYGYGGNNLGRYVPYAGNMGAAG